MEWDDEAVRRISGSAFCGMFHPREILHQTTCWNVDGYVWPGLQRLRETSLCDWRPWDFSFSVGPASWWVQKEGMVAASNFCCRSCGSPDVSSVVTNSLLDMEPENHVGL